MKPEMIVVVFTFRFCVDYQLKCSAQNFVGGDGTVRVWDMEDGKQIAQCDCLEKKAIHRCRMFTNSSFEVFAP